MTMQDSTSAPLARLVGTSAEAPASDRRAIDSRKVVLGNKARSVAMSFREEAISPSIVSGIAAILDFLLMIAIGIVGLKVWTDDFSSITQSQFGPLIGVPILTVFGIQVIQDYSIGAIRQGIRRVGRSIVVLLLTISALLALMFVGEVGIAMPRDWLLIWAASQLASLVLSSLIVTSLVRHWTHQGRLQTRAVIVGGGAPAEDLIKAVERNGRNELKILGIFDDRKDDRSPENTAGYPKLGNVAELEVFARLAAIDMVIVSIPLSAEARLLQILKRLWVLPVNIRLSALSSRIKLRPRAYSYIAGVPFLDVFDKPIVGWDRIAKRIFDVVFASLALVVFSPVMIAAAAAVKLNSPGPVFFRQKRYGFNNEVVSVLKFRSMYQEMADPKAERVVTRDDTRVTTVGRLMRRTSIDELPQLINVLKGELSLVGPRPHAVNAHTAHKLWEEVVDGYFARHRVKPGVTGWAQINGLRGEIDKPEKIQERVQYDLEYIDNWSILFDLYILFLTPIRILNQENAY
ncbi:UDP-glucose:undecaprenyl-phosphate glucose-1-phosphate transferase [Hartmannibacter diazotrophicus]|uniref:UDP-glucose:undecaprenyl-phosphate glucose-1-phosphate transferase n=1 Tax=Hartmannibacter diazotrophicus TaxID=1482074 RepID=A0A2C9D3G6_9HYPH|nr:undecaprenyl-phosphate glucose phosphotransferase [Hartmannibacter diazotrophicus]SON54810.1 UDP-glucose:undecaprenyl-phosphate glucose-1-phosphate transferase [Hartmannibacter diazotrophicus]